MNIIPEEPGIAPNYWCTWAVQNFIYGQTKEDFDLEELEGNLGALHARSNLNEELLLSKDGWANVFYPKVRRDIYLLLDDGWDVPTNTTEDSTLYFSSFHLNGNRFPSIKGEPQERLKTLNDTVKKIGWKGIGLWVACQEATNYLTESDHSKEEYWTNRIKWSRYAGIKYWKVDWGRKALRTKFRRYLTELSQKLYPDLKIEHAIIRLPFNSYQSDGRVESNFVKRCAKWFNFSDVLRLYDVSPQLSIPTMLDRVANVLKEANSTYQGRHLVNCEDEVYIAAALGCTTGVLRHPLIGLRPQEKNDLSFVGPRQIKKRMDEVVRAIHWHRIAPPFSVGSSAIYLDNRILFDSWDYQKGDTWFSDVFGKNVRQGAPARVSRGISLPIVDIDDEPPFVIASQNPNGAISIATLGRTLPDKGYFNPKAEITLNITKLFKYIGIFGYFKTLTLKLDEFPKEIWAQDLAGDHALNISNDLTKHNNSLILSGELIEKIGQNASSPGDISEPGLVIYFN